MITYEEALEIAKVYLDKCSILHIYYVQTYLCSILHIVIRRIYHG